ncbi:YihY/virulence factor BrkB family protein [Micromonospora sp. NPDC048999]|uniref:YihY/virulence factor BrkB family protein n=1 Tax=Micromonospora sp. NPDC048999 TaxID=3155391 RepID=UPI003411F25A
MAADESSAHGGRDRGRQVGPDAGPGRPSELPVVGWGAALRRAVRETREDRLTDSAAALTYYAMLSIFPGALVFISVLGLFDTRAPEKVRNVVDEAVPEEHIRRIIETAIDQARTSEGLASVAAVVGLVGALWAASSYLSAFMRAANIIYEVPEGRPIWKRLPIRLGATVLIGVMLLASVVIVVFTGGLAERVGAFGLGPTAVTVWKIVRWPVLLVLVSLILAILYRVAPNARQGGFRWISPGSVLAVVIWLVISVLFAVYVGHFHSYNKTYGALAGVIIFLVWLWLSNIAILFGVEFDAELARSRAIATGHPAEREPYVELRDDRKLRKKHDGR